MGKIHNTWVNNQLNVSPYRTGIVDIIRIHHTLFSLFHSDPNIEDNNKPKWNPVTDELFFYRIDVAPQFEKYNWQNLYSFYEDLGWRVEV